MTVVFVLGVVMVDAGLWLSERRVAQSAADAAALAGAVSLGTGDTSQAVTKARAWATLNGYTQGTDGATVIVNWPYCGPDGTGTCDNTKIEAKVSKPAPILFGSIFSLAGFDVGARAVGAALVTPQFYALFSHGSSCSGDITMSGGGNTIIGAVQANGDLTTSGSSATNPTSITGLTGYACTINTDNNTTISPAPVQQTLDWPAYYAFTDFEQRVAYSPAVSLNAAVTLSQTTIPIQWTGVGLNPVGKQIIIVDNEALLVTTAPTGISPQTLTVTRGCCGTAAAAHAADAAVVNACTYSSSGDITLDDGTHYNLVPDPGYTHTLNPGVYCSGGKISCHCDNTDGNVTLVTVTTGGTITVSGGSATLNPFLSNQVLTFSSSNSNNNAVVLSGGGSHWNGIIVAEFGGVSITGGTNAAGAAAGIIGAIMAEKKITISGGRSEVQAAYLGGGNVSVALIE